MNQAKAITPIKLQNSIWPVFWLFISLLIFTACLGGGDTTTVTGDVTQLAQGSQATVVCTAACAQWAQCGQKTDNSGQVILAGQGGPAVMNHELIFPNNTPVQIDGQEVRSLQPVIGDPMNLNFYYVIATDDSRKGGWVAGWCVQAAAN